MAKVVFMPRIRTAEPSLIERKQRCAFTLEGSRLLFDCQGCPAAGDAPAEGCLAGFRAALDSHPEAGGILLRGEQDVWIRERGLDSLRSLMGAERAWEDFRTAVRSLPCPRPLSMDRVSRYVEKVAAGRSALFCLGEGPACAECLSRQERALDLLCADRRRARRERAADRFHITEVQGASTK